MNSQSFFLTHAQDISSHQKTVDCWKKSGSLFGLILDNNALFWQEIAMLASVRFLRKRPLASLLQMK